MKLQPTTLKTNALALFLVTISLLFNSCAVHKKAFKRGEEAMRQKDWDRSVANYLKAVEKQPDNVEYRISLSRALLAASNSHLRKGIAFFKDGEYKLALLSLDKSL